MNAKVIPTAVVTSCSAKGWEEYGGRFVESYAQHWSKDIPLYLVSEDVLAARTFCAGGRLFWVDADVFTFAPVTHDLLNRVLPAERALSCLDRGQYHSECGFVGYNLDDSQARVFIT